MPLLRTIDHAYVATYDLGHARPSEVEHVAVGHKATCCTMYENIEPMCAIVRVVSIRVLLKCVTQI